VITAKPPTNPTSHNGILPVFVIKKLLLSYILRLIEKITGK
jgi:hypothetical protein